MLSGPATEDGPWRARHPVPATVCNLYHDLDAETMTTDDDLPVLSSNDALQLTRFAAVLFIAAFDNFQLVVDLNLLNVARTRGTLQG